MKNSVMKRLVALLLSILMAFSVCLSLTSCIFDGNSDDSDGNNGGSEEDSQDGGDSGESTDYHDKIVVPAYKDFGRNTINFDEISYSRPNFEAVISAFSDVIVMIEDNALDFESQVQAIVDLEDEYSELLTMYSLANIYNSKDSSSAFWNAEYSYVTSNYPAFAEVIEDMFVAAANSPHAERFESEYFGEGLIEEYKDGGKFTDEMIALWADEEALEAEYSSLSTATVTVTYKSLTDTVDNIIAYYLDKFGETSSEYLEAYTVCMASYETAVNEKYREIFIDLIKVRKKIANELGCESYMTYGYEVLGRDYSGEDIDAFLSDVAEYVVPVYSILSYYSFNSYFANNLPTEITLDALINDGYEMISEFAPELADIYHYMLQHKLYDIELEAVNRQTGAFTTYLDSYNAPYIFLSASGDITDYATLFHEFGHFADAYINYNESTSIDEKEISSQGLEYLMLVAMEDYLTPKELQYLTYSKLCDALETLIFQGFYAKLEELIYALDENEITGEKLNEQVVEAAKLFGLNTSYVNDISVAFIPHTFLYPFYVQSYAVSVIPALEIYFAEIESPGAGLDAYRKIIDRSDKTLTFEESITEAGLSSPFEKDVLRTISDKIYYRIIGVHIYEDEKNITPDNINAA